MFLSSTGVIYKLNSYGRREKVLIILQRDAVQIFPFRLVRKFEVPGYIIQDSSFCYCVRRTEYRVRLRV